MDGIFKASVFTGEFKYILHKVDESYVQQTPECQMHVRPRREEYAPFLTMMSVSPALGRSNRHIDAGVPKERHVTTMRIESAHINPRRDMQLTGA